MNDLWGLYDEEDKALHAFKTKAQQNNISRKDLAQFIDSYQDLLIQSKVITKVSDKLQSKLNKANERIVEQNEEIVEKNSLLESTIGQLVKAQVGKKASTIIFTAAVIMFLSEEVFLGEAIAVIVHIQYLDLVVKGCIAFGLKFLEGGLETFFMKKEQIKIVKGNNGNVPELENKFKLPTIKLSPSIGKLLFSK
ncbi:MAG: hypothetical protein RIB71_02640 [Imperialibacter sp.]|uniref:hypothetical protein n=1 Tax=Imperialibacter sp. TaxID=2038411 RepID=UPI0032EAF464